ncbi:hypothetical protein CerSpe_249680 [Prunus speciosa]
MKQNYQVFLMFSLLAFLIFSTSSHARLLQQNQASLSATNDPIDLMGSEECDDRDEECLKRRLIAEAHLDYIYTQNHKP